jgi:hypothetical protein
VKTIAAIYLAIATICAIVQLVLGANIGLLCALYLISLCGLFPLYGPNMTVSSMIYISICLYGGFFAILIKTLLWQPVQENLFSPDRSALILLLGHIGATCAYFVARKFRVGAGFFDRLKVDFDRTGQSTPLFPFLFTVGIVFAIAHEIFRPRFVNGSTDALGGFGGFGAFYFLILFGFAGQVALAVSGRARSRDMTVAIVMFVMVLILSVVGNVKKDVIDAALIIALTLAAFKVKVRPTHVLYAVLFLSFTQFIVSPLIHITRAESTSRTMSERIELTGQILKQNNYDFGRINSLNDRVAKGFQNTYRSSGSYVYPSTANIDRFALVLPVDQVARVNDPGRLTPGEVTRLVAQRVLPGGLISKSPGVVADLVAWKYGFRAYLTVGRPVVGLSASSYALGGLGAVLGISFFLLVVVFTLLDMIGGTISRSPWAVGVVMAFSYIAEKEMDALVGTLFRDIPLLVVTLAIVVAVTRMIFLGGYKASGPVTGIAAPRSVAHR